MYAICNKKLYVWNYVQGINDYFKIVLIHCEANIPVVHFSALICFTFRLSYPQIFNKYIHLQTKNN